MGKRKYKIAASFTHHKQKLAAKETGVVTHVHSVYTIRREVSESDGERGQQR